MSEPIAARPPAASQLVIRNQLSALREMSSWLDATIRRLEMPERLLFAFDLCANEAVANIISYAYPEDGAHEIVLRLVPVQGALCLEIEDDGIPFNPLEQPEHDRPASLEDAQIGGLGVDLIRNFMDECRSARRGGRNGLEMVARTEE